MVTINKNTKYLIGGILIGVASGFILGHHIGSERAKALYSEEIDTLNGALRIELGFHGRNVPLEEESVESEEVVSDYSESIDDLRNPYISTEKTIYDGDRNRVIKDIVNDALAAQKDGQPIPSGIVYPNQPKRDLYNPYTITYEEYEDEEFIHFDKLSLVYYSADEVLADERDNVVEDVSNIVGEYALSTFGADMSEPDIVYVRNEKMEADFEISRDQRSYTELVMGFVGDASSSQDE